MDYIFNLRKYILILKKSEVGIELAKIESELKIGELFILKVFIDLFIGFNDYSWRKKCQRKVSLADSNHFFYTYLVKV
jgi:hypothetical protein